jgi:hypothetical protein
MRPNLNSLLDRRRAMRHSGQCFLIKVNNYLLADSCATNKNGEKTTAVLLI